jgi:hypothetical protein
MKQRSTARPLSRGGLGFILCCGSIIGLHAFAFAVSESKGLENRAVFEEFKKFIESPPAIEFLAYEFVGPRRQRFDPKKKY